MAVNQIFTPHRPDNRARVVPAGTKSGDALLIDGRPCVAQTDRGDATRALDPLPSAIATLTYYSGGASLEPDQASVSFNGTFLFEVTGATATTANDLPVYITGAGALTLTEGSNTLFGHTDYPESFNKVAGKAPVRIGVI